MELKERIYKARSDANLTQEQLANAVKKTRGAVAQWESGEVRPRHPTLQAIAEATDKPVAWFLTDPSANNIFGSDDDDTREMQAIWPNLTQAEKHTLLLTARVFVTRQRS